MEKTIGQAGGSPRNVTREEVQQQREYAARVKALWQQRGKTPLAYVRTYGCQQNVSDGERFKGLLVEMGYQLTSEQENADFILYNTCAVREHAQDRVMGNVGALKHLKARKPDLVIALCGCMMQQEHVAEKIRKSYPHVGLVFGTHALHRLPQLVLETLTDGKRVFDRDACDGVIAEGLPVVRDGGVRGWLPVMYGCNNFCTYCVVPYVRGRERSREPGNILQEAWEMLEGGVKDITLLGQNVNSYRGGGMNFAQLVREACALPGEFTLRFMTSHPKDCTKELLAAMAECDKAARHLHLPFQSGSNRVLKEMNRQYTRERYLELVRTARELMPDISLTSDVIVGFPGETYEDFQETLSLVREVGFTSLYTFIFSPREGTPAARMPDPVSREEKAGWLAELLAVQEECAARRTADMVGRRLRVLCEGKAKRDGWLIGRTSGNVIIEFPGGAEWIGRFVSVDVTEALTWIVKGRLALP